MADEIKETLQEVDETPQGETEAAEPTDWKAEARKWERYAKKAQAAEKELAELKAAQMTEQEKATARAEAAEAELAKLQAEKAKVDAATKLARDTGVPFDMLMFCQDEEAMTDFASKYASEQPHISAAPSALAGKRIVRGNDTPATAADMFADALVQAGF